MKNFWLNRRRKRILEETLRPSKNVFVDLSQVSSAGGRYKEYERLQQLISDEDFWQLINLEHVELPNAE